MANSNIRVAGRANGRSIGVTLVELMIATALLTVAFGTIYTVARATFVNTAFHDAEIAVQEEARRALQLMVTELRQALKSSLSGQTLPNDQLTFEIPGDADGNGLPLDLSGYLESVGTVTYTRDLQDLNGDGITTTQLVRVYRDDTGVVSSVTVVANDIAPNEDVNGNGTLDAGEDLNASRVLERGVWFDLPGSLLRITVDSQKVVGEGRRVWGTMTANVYPRN